MHMYIVYWTCILNDSAKQMQTQLCITLLHLHWVCGEQNCDFYFAASHMNFFSSFFKCITISKYLSCHYSYTFTYNLLFIFAQAMTKFMFSFLFFSNMRNHNVSHFLRIKIFYKKRAWACFKYFIKSNTIFFAS